MILSLLALITIACVTQAQLVPEFAKITKGCTFVGELPSAFDQCGATSSGATAAVRCCEDIDSSTVTCDSPNCDFDSVTFLFAQEVCANASMRLCTEREIDTESICCSTGCGFDADPVWTADECAPQYLAVDGCPTDDIEIETSCMSAADNSSVAAVRCCNNGGSVCQSYCPADTELYPGTTPTDSLLATNVYAQAFCESQNQRLCTVDEMDACCGTGCDHNTRLTWTNQQCIPTPAPTRAPIPVPTNSPSPVPSPSPTTAPSPQPTDSPTSVPSPEPTNEPTVPSPRPTNAPTDFPTRVPTGTPTVATASPTVATASPTVVTASPTVATASPTVATASPTQSSEQEISAATSYRQAKSSALWATAFSMILAVAALTR